VTLKKNNDHARRETQRRGAHKLRKAKARAEATRQLNVFFQRRLKQ
jgi:hypothetical protein